MEIGENVESKSSIQSLQTVQSVPILSASTAEASQRDDKEGGRKKSAKNRRVSFASTQLAQYLEPINPFESLSECYCCTVISPESISLKNARQANDDDVGGNETSGNCRKTIFCNFPLCKYFFLSLSRHFPIEHQFQSRVPKSSRASTVDHVRSTTRLRYRRL